MLKAYFYYLLIFLYAPFFSSADNIDILFAAREELKDTPFYTAQQLQRTWQAVKNEDHYQLFIVEKGKAIGPKGNILNLLNAICKRYPVPDLSFIYYNHDIAPKRKKSIGLMAPIFCSSKRKGDKKVLLFSDWHYNCSDLTGGWQGLYSTLLPDANIPPWQERLPKLVWRGSTNEGGYTKSNWHSKPRGYLVFLSKELYPELIDAGFSMHHPWNIQDREFFYKELTSPSLSALQQSFYKYQIDIDGVTATFTGLAWKMLAGSIVFKQDSDNVMWFHHLLKPYEHYMPVKRDLSDIVEKLLWAVDHDEQAYAIAQRGRQKIIDALEPESILAYCFFVLKGYAARKSD
jgi:hypothetical protein